MKQTYKKRHRFTYIRSLVLLIVALITVAGTCIGPRNTSAATLGEQIQVLRNQIAQDRAKAADLRETALSYQDAINRLEGQINQLQGEINQSIARQNELRAKIDEGERELARQRKLLGEDIKAMYTDGDISTIEMLATSKDLSEFIDKDTYRNAVQEKIQETLKKIAKLQAELRQQEDEVAELLAKQQAQQTSLNASRAEQAQMLAYNKAQQADFNSRASANQARLDDLIAQQLRANQGTPSGGYYFIRFPGTVQPHDVGVDDYPYKGWGFSMADAPCLGPPRTPDSQDRWGYCTRQCVSYAAWAVERSGRVAPKYYGSAKYWIDSAPASWIHLDPQPGDVAISVAGFWGHAMYVEQVDGNRIYVSQYNNSLTGRYSTQWRTYR